jgi:hypothetical protein
VATELGPEGMRKLIDEHSGFEQAHDWGATLATMVDEPFYEFYPYRLRISGPESVTAMWIRIFRPGKSIIHCFDQSFSVPGTHRLEEYVNDDTVLHLTESSFLAEDGQTRTSKKIVRYAFDGDKMLSETLFLDRSLTPYFDAVFDEEFRSLRGVELI